MELVLDMCREETMTALSNKLYNRHRKATEEKGEQRTGGKEIWTCRQQVSSTAGERWRQQQRTELDEDKCSVAYVPLGVTR